MPQFCAWFDLDHIGRSPARFDSEKLTSLNAHYLRSADPHQIVRLVLGELALRCDGTLAPTAEERLKKGLDSLRERARTVNELCANARFYAVDGPVTPDAGAAALLTADARARLGVVVSLLSQIQPWQAAAIEGATREACEARGWKLKDVAQPLRAAVTGSRVSPPLFELMEILGREETIVRVEGVA